MLYISNTSFKKFFSFSQYHLVLSDSVQTFIFFPFNWRYFLFQFYRLVSLLRNLLWQIIAHRFPIWPNFLNCRHLLIQTIKVLRNLLFIVHIIFNFFDNRRNTLLSLIKVNFETFNFIKIANTIANISRLMIWLIT